MFRLQLAKTVLTLWTSPTTAALTWPWPVPVCPTWPSTGSFWTSQNLEWIQTTQFTSTGQDLSFWEWFLSSCSFSSMLKSIGTFVKEGNERWQGKIFDVHYPILKIFHLLDTLKSFHQIVPRWNVCILLMIDHFL